MTTMFANLTLPQGIALAGACIGFALLFGLNAICRAIKHGLASIALGHEEQP